MFFTTAHPASCKDTQPDKEKYTASNTQSDGHFLDFTFPLVAIPPDDEWVVQSRQINMTYRTTFGKYAYINDF
jgi:hypothetical protein